MAGNYRHYALHLELKDLLQVTRIMAEQSESAAIAQIFQSLPFGQVALAALLVVAVVLLATNHDSDSFTLASVSTYAMHAGENPARWLRVFWACALAVFPLALMFIHGGLKVLLSTTIIVSLLLLAVGYLMATSLLKMLREDYPLA